MTLITDELLNVALAAGQTEYRRVFQLTHDPRVSRLVDAAVESALEAVAPLIAAKALRDAGDSASARPGASPLATFSVATALHARADRIARGEP